MVSYMNTMIGVASALKLTNGKFKPKFGIRSIIAVIVFCILLLAFAVGFVYGILCLNFEFIFTSVLGICGIVYMLLITHVTQSPNNYRIQLQSDDSLTGFELFYKNKKVDIRYKADTSGRIAFADNNKKTRCVSYADGTKMSNITKYKIVNYFGKWLHDNNLLSDEVTVTFEL